MAPAAAADLQAAAAAIAAPAAALPTVDGCIIRKNAVARRPLSETAPLVSWRRIACDSASRADAKAEHAEEEVACSNENASQLLSFAAEKGEKGGSGEKAASSIDGGKTKSSGDRPAARPAAPNRMFHPLRKTSVDIDQRHHQIDFWRKDMAYDDNSSGSSDDSILQV